MTQAGTAAPGARPGCGDGVGLVLERVVEGLERLGIGAGRVGDSP